MLNSKRGMLVMLLTVLLALPSQAGAQQSTQDDSKRGKRPPLRVRVVTDSSVGVPVVVAQSEQSAAVAGSNGGVPVRFVRGPGARQHEPDVENWLVGGPSRHESWLNGPPGGPGSAPGAMSGAVSAGTPAVTPAMRPTVATVATPSPGQAMTPSTRLLGVQHYMESTQARPASGSAAANMPPVTFTVPPSPSPSRSANADATPRRTAATPVAVAGTYQLGPGDQIDVHVWRSPDLSRSVPVRPDGLISLPLVGELEASGKTVAELNADITTILEEYVQHPTVTVTVTQVRSMVVYVSGRVIRAGPLTLHRPINVVQAITMAGGVQEFANRNGVVVIRTINGRRVRIPYRYGDAVKGKGNIAELVLQSGDVVYVP